MYVLCISIYTLKEKAIYVASCKWGSYQKRRYIFGAHQRSFQHVNERRSIIIENNEICIRSSAENFNMVK